MDYALTLATVPAVLAIVNLAKGLGVSGRWSALTAVLVAVSITVATELVGDSGLFQAAASGLLLGLSAAGLYDVAQGGDPKSGDVPRMDN